MKEVSKMGFALTLLGYPNIQVPNSPVPKLPTVKAQAILFYLVAEKVLNGEQAVSKEKLVDLLWPGMPIPSALQNLRQTIYQIRKTFPQGDTPSSPATTSFLQTDRKNVWLSEGVPIHTDIDWYRESERFLPIEAVPTEALINLYSSPFLENFSVPSTPQYDEWIEQCRNQLIRQHIVLLEQYYEHLLEKPDPSSALLITERLIQHEPYTERYRLNHLKLLGIRGQKNKAIQAFHEYSNWLKEELDATPGPQLEALFHTIQQTAPFPPSHSAKTHTPPQSYSTHSRRYGIMGLLILATVLFTLFWRKKQPQTSPQEIRLAILPLKNLTSKVFLADGLTDDILMGLTKVEGVKMISRQSSAQFKDTLPNSAQIGRELTAQYLLQGSVAQPDHTYKVNLQLLESASGEILWAETFLHDTSQIPTLLHSITTRISSHLHQRFGWTNTDIPSPSVSPNSAAYQAYLKGRYLFYQANPQSLHEALTHFQQASELDPQFDLAHAWAAWTYCTLAGSWGDQSASTMYPSVQKELAFIEDNPELKGMYFKILGWMHFWLLDRSSAEKYLRQSVAIDPNEEFGLSGLAMVLTLRRNYHESTQIAQQALDLNPHFFWNHFVLGQAFYYEGEFEEARIHIEKGLSLYAHHQASIGIRANLLAVTGEFEEATTYLSEVLAQFTVPPSTILADQGLVYATGGNSKQAEAIAQELLVRHQQQEKYTAYFAAKIFAVLGQQEKALDLLEDAFQTKDNELNWVEVDWEFRSLHGNPRFQELLQGIQTQVSPGF